ncbi:MULTISPECIES: CsbD family protein [Streptomyces]|uniref:CsbD family protein n=1 Tax=Streptomyces sudanensis TaxID=436397 RepID=A0ABY4TEV4_9ACTN|nr:MULTISPECIES: CsbD family protein [Streptomyces]MCP9956704.1 CsbD family protein [Streptomyces sudanensis]MCP9985912.1 CsbD family protein [Streptomyces sudanensis]MCQ0002698.1 CsbD family protein [Streptomyces sudanensis]URN17457.1 CsbD family protein [Streptomyces sudanensis]
MSAKGKASAKAQQARGAVKENVGRAVGDEEMAAEGGAERARADLREAAEKVKDAFKR